MFIHNISFSNFYSFYEESLIDFTTTESKATPSTDLCCGSYVNKINGVFGANGSGKTNALKAIAFLDFMVFSSFLGMEEKEDIPLETHALHQDEQSNFKIEYSHGDETFRYSISIEKKKLKSETLLFKNKKTGKFNTIFKRYKNGGEFILSSPRKSILPSYAENFSRDNVSLCSYILSAEKQNTLEARYPLLNSGISAFSALRTNVVSSGKNDDLESAIYNLSKSLNEKNSIALKLIEHVVRNIDLGIDRLEVRKIPVIDDKKAAERDLLFATHRDENDDFFSIPVFEESTGTQKILCALWRLLPVMFTGGVAVYDELDSDLHPYMMPFIAELFMNHEVNIGRGQLIFSGHTLESIKDLSKLQVFFVEKHNLRSEIFRADEIEGLRSDDNLYSKYIKGALGGVPELDASEISVAKILDDINEIKGRQ
ncbi:AAA family ATPase [Halomonas sp. V046]|uniref:AAA family ATPase n=1 Tax=Halomonas sp. V046 TaxID=3459611 RepID=UPI0040441190